MEPRPEPPSEGLGWSPTSNPPERGRVAQWPGLCEALSSICSNTERRKGCDALQGPPDSFLPAARNSAHPGGPCEGSWPAPASRIARGRGYPGPLTGTTTSYDYREALQERSRETVARDKTVTGHRERQCFLSGLSSVSGPGDRTTQCRRPAALSNQSSLSEWVPAR